MVGDQTSSSPPAIADIDNDTKADLVYLSGNGNVHVLSLMSNIDDSQISGWATFLHDERHTGSYGSSSILPPAPNNPQAYDTPDDKGGSIIISWGFPSGDINITNYIIFRSDKADGKYAIIGKTEKNNNIFIDNNAEIGITYWYMVRSSNGTNMSSNTNSVSAYSFNNFSPNVPVSVYINNIIIDGVIDIWWKMNEEPNIAGYKVYFGTKSQNYDKIFDAGLVNHYVVTALENNKEYYLCVTAYDKDGNESLKSMEVSAIPKDEDTDPPVFSSFYPNVVVENSEFYIRCEIKDESGIYDDNTTDKGQGVYLIWDVGELSEDSNIVGMSKLRSDEYVTDKRIPGQNLGSHIIYRIVAYDNDFDWGRLDDRTKGISELQKVEFTSAPKKVYNYPNPAPSGAYTDSTIFHYYIDSSSQVTINIYDISGNLVDSLNEQTTSSGHKETEWNISNIASGVYIYTIEIQPDSGNKQLYKSKLAILK
jgi:hypothetical protein